MRQGQRIFIWPFVSSAGAPEAPTVRWNVTRLRRKEAGIGSILNYVLYASLPGYEGKSAL